MSKLLCRCLGASVPFVSMSELPSSSAKPPEAPAGAAVERTALSRLPTRHGEFQLAVYRSLADQQEHAVLIKGDVAADDVLVRMHSECLTGDIFGSLRCDCGDQLALAMQRVQAAGRGVIIYLQGHEGRGIGLTQKIRAYALQDTGLDTVEANEALGLPVDGRRYDAAAAILADLGVRSVRLMSNNPLKMLALEQLGVRVAQRENHQVPSNPENQSYLGTKRDRLGHWLALQSE